MAFVNLEAGLKIDDFSGLPGGTPELRQRTSGVVKSLFRPPLLSLRQRTSGVVKSLFWGTGKQHSYRFHSSVLRLKSSRR
jgi:hypothetical protein